ncbi:MAG: FAD-dependent oxidoreductase [Flavobacteriales bacterium]|nr:FAD-dependent oxidoreductase [Flavobacteriales bacterium]
MIQFEHLSFWEKQTFLEQIDLIVAGSGIVGLGTAIHQKRRYPNKKVVVIERGYLPSGASTKNAGFACIGSASELLSDLDNGSADSVWATVEKRWKGLQYLKELVGVYRLGYVHSGSYELFTAAEKDRFQKCSDQIAELNQKLHEITGIEKVYKLDENVISNSGFEGFKYAISNSAEGMLDTGMMMTALIQKAVESGVILLNGIECKHLESGMLITNYGEIKSKQIAVCTNGFASKLLKLDVKPARAQVVVTSEIEKLRFNSCFHFDEGYYYFRNVGNRVLFGGGRNRDFEAEETDELNTSDQIINHLSYLLESKILPHQSFSIDYQWAGTMGVGDTKAPIIKEISPDLFCAVRMGGMGVAIGSLVGKELSELIGD